MEQSTIGKKTASFFLRMYIILFSRKKLDKIINIKSDKKNV
jgi:hypothetical protein